MNAFFVWLGRALGLLPTKYEQQILDTLDARERNRNKRKINALFNPPPSNTISRSRLTSNRNKDLNSLRAHESLGGIRSETPEIVILYKDSDIKNRDFPALRKKSSFNQNDFVISHDSYSSTSTSSSHCSSSSSSHSTSCGGSGGHSSDD